MITKIKINGKDFNIFPTYGHFIKIVNKYPDYYDMANWDMAKYNQFVFDSLWIILPKNLLFKPFIFKNRMIKKLTYKEVEFFQSNIHNILLGNDIVEGAKGSLGKSQKTKPTT
jgi:hypothetical protein